MILARCFRLIHDLIDFPPFNPHRHFPLDRIGAIAKASSSARLMLLVPLVAVSGYRLLARIMARGLDARKHRARWQSFSPRKLKSTETWVLKTGIRKLKGSSFR